MNVSNRINCYILLFFCLKGTESSQYHTKVFFDTNLVTVTKGTPNRTLIIFYCVISLII